MAAGAWGAVPEADCLAMAAISSAADGASPSSLFSSDSLSGTLSTNSPKIRFPRLLSSGMGEGL